MTEEKMTKLEYLEFYRRKNKGIDVTIDQVEKCGR